MPLTQQELESKLWGAADILRGQIDAADYKNYIFAALFLKRLSDRFDEEVEAAVAFGLSREAALTDADEHEFFVPESARWPALVGASMNLGEALNVAAEEIESANTPRLDGVLTSVNWNDETRLGSPANRERIIRRLLNHFSELDLRDANLQQPDGGTGNVLGDAYEYLIHQFADDAGKKGGEFYTPRSVVRLIVELLAPQEGMRICDPTAGSGGMLIYTAQYVEEHKGNARNLVLEGQERNRGTLAIGKLNLLLHGLRSARLEEGDVIADPRLQDEAGRLLAYDRVIANPPFSLKNWGHDFAPNDPHHRFDRYDAIPPRTRGDLGFLLHMLAVTNAEGMVGVVMPHGVLFRGGAEGKIRRGLLESDVFEAVIGLAPNLFYGSTIPVAICVLNKAKPSHRREKVLIADANQDGYFRQGKAQNFLDREHIEEIVKAYRSFEDVERFAHVAGLGEIEANDFNLNVSRYVDTSEPIEVPSVEEALAELREAERQRNTAAARMDELLEGIGYGR
ncbi:MAG: class I SAM-dependent DNA methyltransferase [Chloroflexota bacterium]|nr:class I SAM-dependent DNA methyltransferase [Chloroflexota bacterium]MDE2920420.1 class I SAM-dependent DNA methyltransferase [Chloroflexota bacterium]